MKNSEKLCGLILTILKVYFCLAGSVLVIIIGMIIGLFIRFNSFVEFQEWLFSLLNLL